LPAFCKGRTSGKYEPPASVVNSLGHRVHRRTVSCRRLDGHWFGPLFSGDPCGSFLASQGEASIVQTAIVLNGTMIGGILGIAAVLMAYRPERLRQSAKLRHRAMIFSSAGVCAAALYLTSEGLTNVLSSVLKCWIIAGPLLVGTHCACRVFVRPDSSTSSSAAG